MCKKRSRHKHQVKSARRSVRPASEPYPVAFLRGYRQVQKGTLAELVSGDFTASELVVALAAILEEREPGQSITLVPGTIARRSGRSLRAIERARRSLEARGLLRKVKDGGGRHPARYVLCTTPDRCDGGNASPPRQGRRGSPDTGDGTTVRSPGSDDGLLKNPSLDTSSEGGRGETSLGDLDPNQAGEVVHDLWVEAGYEAGAEACKRTEQDAVLAVGFARDVQTGQFSLPALYAAMLSSIRQTSQDGTANPPSLSSVRSRRPDEHPSETTSAGPARTAAAQLVRQYHDAVKSLELDPDQGKAVAAANKLLDEFSEADIAAAIDAYAQTLDAGGREPRYRKGAARFFEEEAAVWIKSPPPAGADVPELPVGILQELTRAQEESR